MARSTLCTLTLLLALFRPLAAQRERWQVTLDGDHYLWDIQLVRLDADSLVLQQADTLVRVPVARITEIRLIQASEVQLGGDNAAGSMNALIGGDDQVFDLASLELADRMRAVQRILLDHPAGP